ncbi:MAG: histidinol-phosphatase HisJ family protein [Acetivibrio sp.]
MIITDCHVHSSFSSDSSTPPEVMIQKAIQLGFTDFYLTDHMDYDFPVTPDGLDFQFSPEEYFETLFRLQTKYADRIKIRTGIELGLKPTASVKNKIDTLLSKYRFDLIIGSTHLVNNRDPYDTSFWEGHSIEECLHQYFEQIVKNLQSFHSFQTLGHLDYAIRYAPKGSPAFSYFDYSSIIDEILFLLLEHNIALEVNTAGYKYGNEQPNPSSPIIKRYLSLGGKYLTIGSDAHLGEYYAYGFNKVRHLLQSLGVTQYTAFIQGKPVFFPL